MAFDFTKGLQGAASMGSQGAYIGNQLRSRYGKKGVGIGTGIGAGVGFMMGGMSGGPDPNLGANAYQKVYDSVRADTMDRARQAGLGMRDQIRQALSHRGINTSAAAAGIEAANQGRIFGQAERSLAPFHQRMMERASNDSLQAKRINEHEKRSGWMDTMLALGVTGMNMAKEFRGDQQMRLDEELRQQRMRLPSNFLDMDPKAQVAFMKGRGINFPPEWETMSQQEKDAYIRATGFSTVGPRGKVVNGEIVPEQPGDTPAAEGSSAAAPPSPTELREGYVPPPPRSGDQVPSRFDLGGGHVAPQSAMEKYLAGIGGSYSGPHNTGKKWDPLPPEVPLSPEQAAGAPPDTPPAPPNPNFDPSFGQDAIRKLEDAKKAAAMGFTPADGSAGWTPDGGPGTPPASPGTTLSPEQAAGMPEDTNAQVPPIVKELQRLHRMREGGAPSRFDLGRGHVASPSERPWAMMDPITTTAPSPPARSGQVPSRFDLGSGHVASPKDPPMNAAPIPAIPTGPPPGADAAPNMRIDKHFEVGQGDTSKPSWGDYKAAADLKSQRHPVHGFGKAPYNPDDFVPHSPREPETRIHNPHIASSSAPPPVEQLDPASRFPVKMTKQGETGGRHIGTAYSDPVKGTNIGFGRSLTHNGMDIDNEVVSFIQEELKANGVTDPKQVEAVISKRMQAAGLDGKTGMQTLTKDQFNALFPNGITEGMADTLLENDFQRFEGSLKKILGEDVYKGLSQPQRDSLLDMIYTLGERGFSGFEKMIDAIKSGDFDKAADEAKNSKWYGQVKGRRADPIIKGILTPKEIQYSPAEGGPMAQRLPYNPSSPPTAQNLLYNPENPPVAQTLSQNPRESMQSQLLSHRTLLPQEQQKQLEEASKTPTTRAEIEQWSQNTPNAVRTIFQNPNSVLGKSLMSPHTGHVLASVFAEMGDDVAAEALAIYNSL